jgi:class 3 adenylate cyclase
MPLSIVNLSVQGKVIVVAFDMCSSSTLVEQLTLKGDLKRLQRLLTVVKRFLIERQKTLSFDTYKFIGDGWILLFPETTNGKELLQFLKDLCVFFKAQLRKEVLQYLDSPPKTTGLTFGMDKGLLGAMLMYGQREYVGRAINVACRLQSAIKDKGGSPAYKALVTNAVFNDHLAPATGYRVFKVTHTLRNIGNDAIFKCRKIELLSTKSAS